MSARQTEPTEHDIAPGAAGEATADLHPADLDRQRSVRGVVVVGAGYAGVAAARSVDRRGVDVTIVDAAGTHDFTTRLAAVAGGTAPPDDASTPLSTTGHRIIESTVRNVRDGTVELDDGTTLSADAVVLTVGSVPTQPPIDGIEHSHSLRTADDALTLRAAIGDIEGPAGLIIVGGGASGVQLAGAAAFAHRAEPHQRPLTVTVIEQRDRLLPEMRERTSTHVRRILEERHVEVITGSAVERIDPDGVELPDGRRRKGLVVWAAGFEAHADDYGATLTSDGRVELADDLRVLGAARTFAAGDIAAHTSPSGSRLPMSAQIAEQAGKLAGANAARLVRGDQLEAAELRHRGWVLDLSGRRGVAELGPIVLAAPPLDRLPPLLHWIIDAKHAITVAGATTWLLRRR